VLSGVTPSQGSNRVRIGVDPLIDRQHPAAIAEDIDYSDRSSLGTADGDALALAIAATHHETVFSFVATGAHGHVRFVGYNNGTAFFKAAHSHPAMGLFRTVRSPVSFDGERALEVRPPPTLGEHNDEIRNALKVRGRS